ncbi:MAG: 30S ribosomal protein S8 [Syntrophales bacterium]|nr:30S ribosomal protein S8 [Syntrophales bacterium]
MGMTDTIADMLTRVRNAVRANLKSVDVMPSKMNVSIARILKQEGFIESYEIKKEGKRGHEILRINLRSDVGKKKVLSGLQRVSRPGCRIYMKCEELPYVMGGLGIAILSTSKGVLTDHEARKLKVGGEVICKVW